MLNRRLLRIKVMQSLYALKQSEIANYHNAIGYIEEVFLPDLNSMEKQDVKKLEHDKKKATQHFERYFEKESQAFEKEEPKIKDAIRQAIDQYYKQVEKDKKYFGKLLSKDIDGIHDSYILVFSLLVELAEFAGVDYEEQQNKPNKKASTTSYGIKLKDNQIIELIRKNKEYISNTNKGKFVWNAEVIRSVYKDLKADKTFQEYEDTKGKDFEADKNIVIHILKNLIFKGSYLQSFFEERELNWAENRSIVKSMVVKTIKSVESKTDGVKLLALSANWEEDEIFYEELYQKTVEKDRELERIASEKIKNWDIERVAALDRIILIMAISEMIHFPSIPVKVTINEYIELSKLYSTPKSKQFVNGILDKLAEDLIRKGLIRKSGRGLIDNK